MGNYIETISYINPGDGQNHPIDAVTVGGLTLTSEEKELWSGKQDALTFDSIPTENSDNIVKSGALYSVLVDNELVVATALNDLNDRLVTVETSVDSFAVVTESTVSGWGFTKNSGTVTGISMNGTLIGTSGIINLGTVLTSHQDITGKADKSAAIGSLSLSINSSNYQITLSGTKVDGTSFTVSDVIDLPLETMVVNGSYNDSTKKIELTLKNGNTVDFSVSDLVAGLQSEITSSNKLSADLISDGNTNKVVTATEKSTWNSAVRSVTFNGNSVSVSDGSISMSESDPVFSASPAAGISAADISNWNSKTSNTGTLTGVTFNGTSASVSNGVAAITAEENKVEIIELSSTSLNTLPNAPSGTFQRAYAAYSAGKTVILRYNINDSLYGNYIYDYILSYDGTIDDEYLCFYDSCKNRGVELWNNDNISTNQYDVIQVNGTAITPRYVRGAINISVPAEVTEATVSSWGFTKNSGTLTSHATHKLNIGSATATAAASNTITYVESLTGTTTATSGNLTITPTLKTITVPAEVTESTVAGWGFTKNAGTLTSESDPVFSSSIAASISAADISNWNSKTSNTGTLTGVTFNGVSASVSNGVVSISANVLPSVSASDNGKYLKVSNGQWDLATPLTVYSGSGTPSNSLGNDGDIYLQQ